MNDNEQESVDEAQGPVGYSIGEYDGTDKASIGNETINGYLFRLQEAKMLEILAKQNLEDERQKNEELQRRIGEYSVEINTLRWVIREMTKR